MSDPTPRVEVTQETNSTIKFIMRDCDASLANALRRVMISEVPTIAIDEVMVRCNTSTLADEVLCHRMGLIPLTSQRALSSHPDPMVMKWDCDCQDGMGCRKCGAMLKLEKLNDTEEQMDVTTEDIVSDDVEVMPFDHSRSSVGSSGFMSEDDAGANKYSTVLLKLAPGQEVSFEFIARRGIGKMHAKWSPVATAVFRYEADVRLNSSKLDRLSADTRREWTQSCPTRVFSFNEVTQHVEVTNPAACMFCNECVVHAKLIPDPITGATKNFIDIVSIEERPNKFLFTVESSGGLAARDIVMQAAEICAKKCQTVREGLPRQPLQ